MQINRAIVVDDDGIYRERTRGVLEEVGFAVSATSDIAEAKDFTTGADLVVLDNFQDDGVASYWERLMGDLRRNHPSAHILLVSGFEDNELINSIENAPTAKALVESDPYISYLPKGFREADRGRHFEALAGIARKTKSLKEDRRFLQRQLVQCCLESVLALYRSPLNELTKSAGMGKADTTVMDVIAEERIMSMFLPHTHKRNVVICTEELGVHNRLIHRVLDPNFYIFSDPFDGSTAFKNLVASGRSVADNLWALQAEMTDPASEASSYWMHAHGDVGLNAPVVSLVLTERHRVVGAVIANLFTANIYVSLDHGNFWTNAERTFASILNSRVGEETALLKQLVDKLEIESSSVPSAQWNSFSLKAGSPSLESGKLFLCSIANAKKQRQQDDENRRKERETPTNPLSASSIITRPGHAESCIRSLLPPEYSWSDSFDLRVAQSNFTPGPARLLFLSDTAECREYNKVALRGRCYSCVISAGEPITEWMGWFAFLRHSPELQAYCLRSRGDLFGHCMHREKPESPTTQIPGDVESIFKDGYLDIAVLPVAYGRRMRGYTDTILICAENDLAWQRMLKDGDEDRFIAIKIVT